MARTFAARLLRWLPTVAYALVLAVALAVGTMPTPGITAVAIVVQIAWIGVPWVARKAGVIYAERHRQPRRE